VVCGRRLVLAALTWLVFLAGAQAAAASNDVTYNGGPVAHSMTGVIVDWGSNVNPMYTNETSGDPGLIKYLASQSGSTGDIGGVLAQYMDSSGHNAANAVSYGQQYEITPSVTSTTISDSQIASELVSQIQAGHLPHPAGNGLGTIYLVLFPVGDAECAGAQDCSANAPDTSSADLCAYHSGTTLSDGTALLYAVLPDDTSGPMSDECGQAPTVLQDQTSHLSHEWSETISDPLGNAWWVNDTSSGDDGNEIGDNCNQMMSSEGGWTVQLEWSNLDGNCVGSELAYSAPTASFVNSSLAAPNEPVSFDALSSTERQPSPPNATTGAASAVTSSAATISGTVAPNGVATTYHVEFGTTTAYGQSTAPVSAGSGTSAVAVSATLAGLRSDNVYHYRLVATSAGSTSVGSDATLRTARAPAPPPRFSFGVRAIHGRVQVRFRCSTGCAAHFVVTVASAHVTRFTPVTVILGRGVGRLRRPGTGTAILTLRTRRATLSSSSTATPRPAAPPAPRRKPTGLR
jgi:hypothetical protein